MAGHIPHHSPTEQAVLKMLELWSIALDSGFDLTAEQEDYLRRETIALGRRLHATLPPPRYSPPNSPGHQ